MTATGTSAGPVSITETVPSVAIHRSRPSPPDWAMATKPVAPSVAGAGCMASNVSVVAMVEPSVASINRPRTPSSVCSTARTRASRPRGAALTVLMSLTVRVLSSRRSRMVNGPGVWGQDATHRSSSLTWHVPVPISVASSAPVASEHPSWDTTATPRRSTTACSGPSLVADLGGRVPRGGPR